MSRGRIVVFGTVLALAVAPPRHVPAVTPAAGIATAQLAELQGRGLWSTLRCSACIGGLLGASVLEPWLPYVFDEDGNVLAACEDACKGVFL